MDFENVMGALVNYCLVEAHPATRSYSMHNSVHDWTLAQLNKKVSQDGYKYAVACVVASVGDYDWERLGQLHYACLARHALRLVREQFLQNLGLSTVLSTHFDQVHVLADLLSQQVQLSAAENMYLRALAGYEKALGPDHTSTLMTVNNLGSLYNDQGKLDEAEQMYQQALAGYEKALGPDHTSTLNTVGNLGILYRNQDKWEEAEQMSQQAIAGKEKVLGPDHTSTLDTINNLGALYAKQGKLDEAERTCLRALIGYEKTFGQKHRRTLRARNLLDLIRQAKHRADEAE